MRPRIVYNRNDMTQARRILLICNESVGENMAGPAIRYWEFGRALSRYFTVTLAIPPFIQPSPKIEYQNMGFTLHFCQTQAELQQLAQQAEVIVTVADVLSIYHFLTKTKAILVVDMYIPLILEGLQKHADKPFNERNLLNAGYRGVHTRQLRTADFIICASEKQQDYWLGWLTAIGRVNPYTHSADPTLAKLIGVVPFGLPSQPAEQTRPVLKGVYPHIAPHDQVILWGGGIWNWLDWQTMLYAMQLISAQTSQVKLFFMGIKSPNAASSTAVAQAIALSQQLRLYDKQVFFNDWVPYQERQNYLLEADIGVSLHLAHVETRFAFRTRLLDYIWAGLPMVVTVGDVLSEEVAHEQLGQVVKSGDVAGVSQAILTLLGTPNLRERYRLQFERVRAKYDWDEVLKPLIHFCESPTRAPDKPYLANIPLIEPGLTTWQTMPRQVWQAIKNGQLGVKMRAYVRWKLR